MELGLHVLEHALKGVGFRIQGCDVGMDPTDHSFTQACFLPSVEAAEAAV